MTKLKNILLKSLFRERKNLVSLENHYSAMAKLLAHQQIAGVIDAGASDGRITKKLLKIFPDATSYLFEAHSDYSRPLKEYAKRDSRVKPQLMVLSDKTGEEELILSSRIGRTSLFPSNERAARLAPELDSGIRKVKVPSITIDDWVESRDKPEIHVMKFDIQAGELKALQGAVNTLRDSTLLVYTEVFFNPMYSGGALFGEIDSFLRDHSFILHDIYKPKYGADGVLSYANAIFISKRLQST